MDPAEADIRGCRKKKKWEQSETFVVRELRVHLPVYIRRKGKEGARLALQHYGRQRKEAGLEFIATVSNCDSATCVQKYRSMQSRLH